MNAPVSEKLPIPVKATEQRKPSNRRLSMRRIARGGSKVACRKGSMGMGPNIAVSLLDVSECGVRLVVTEMLAVRQEVEICLLAPGQHREVKLVGRVIWTVPTSDGRYATGIEFDKRLSYSLVHDLGRFSS